MIVLDCIEDSCTFQTQEVEQELALQLLILHVNTQHTAAGAAVGGRQQATQAEHVKRPLLMFMGPTLE